MQANYLIGDDIVDISSDEILGKYRDSRFVARVLSREERSNLDRSPYPERLFWKLWAAKEASFKALAKKLPGLIFSPSSFKVHINDCLTEGHVKYGDSLVPIFWKTSRNWIYCVALLENGTDGTTSPEMSFKVGALAEVANSNIALTPGELLSAYSAQSRGVRILAKLILKNKYNLTNIEIIRPSRGRRFAPPAIYMDGRQIDSWDLSMSHDGKYISCAFLKG